jgi:glycosyltransferase involved in cell wall biosynthesis
MDCSPVPLVTVGLIVRNEAKHIGETLDHLARLHFEPGRWELIVVDGQSTDGTWEIVESFAANAPPMIVRPLREEGEGESERGHGNARNMVLTHARGQYVAFTDADCIVAPDWLAVLVSELESERARDARVVAVGGIRYPIETNHWKEKLLNAMLGTLLGSGGSAGFVFRQSRYVDSIGNYNAIYVREIAVAQKYRPIRVGEDFEFNRRLNRLGHRIVLSPLPKVFHHQEHSFRAFLRQMMAYGHSQARVWKRFGEVRRFAPIMALFWLGVLIGWTSIFLSPYLFWAYCLTVASYSLVVAATAVSVALKMRSVSGLAAIALFPMQHAMYAWGFMRGLARS